MEPAQSQAKEVKYYISLFEQQNLTVEIPTVGMPGNGPYSATKFAVRGLTQSAGESRVGVCLCDI